jgi:hypothetical protein
MEMVGGRFTLAGNIPAFTLSLSVYSRMGEDEVSMLVQGTASDAFNTQCWQT